VCLFIVVQDVCLLGSKDVALPGSKDVALPGSKDVALPGSKDVACQADNTHAVGGMEEMVPAFSGR
jgi:hypothetical protein